MPVVIMGASVPSMLSEFIPYLSDLVVLPTAATPFLWRHSPVGYPANTMPLSIMSSDIYLLPFYLTNYHGTFVPHHANQVPLRSVKWRGRCFNSYHSQSAFRFNLVVPLLV